jgi:hypothetical protein
MHLHPVFCFFKGAQESTAISGAIASLEVMLYVEQRP